ncbi:MAG: hypothetical protein ABI461_03735 [Polyangiaceae bacterium]
MKSIRSLVIPFAAVVVTLLSLSGSAHADVLPADTCAVEDLGKSCDNAGVQGDEPGTCEQSTCSHSTRNEDGGFTVTTSDCTLCVASDGGKATTTRDDAGTAASPSSSSSGCSVTPNTRDGATAFAMLGLGVLGLALGRRKAKR